MLLASTAHELRLPLSHIKGFVSSLRRTDVEWDKETRRDFFQEIEQEVERLDELIEGLLRDSAPHHAHPGFVKPATLIKAALGRIRSLPSHRWLQLDLPADLPAVPLQAGRRRIVKLSPRGRRATDTAFEAFAEIEADWTKRLGERRMKQLIAMLTDLADIER